jgi:hypothetical protein
MVGPGRLDQRDRPRQRGALAASDRRGEFFDGGRH